MSPNGKLTVGENLSEVFALYGRHYGVLLPVAFWLFLGVEILGGVSGSDTGLVFLALMLSFAVAILYQGMVVSLVRDVRRGGAAPVIGEMFGSVGPVLPTLLVASVLYGVGVAVGFAFLIVPGCILLTIWAVIAPVIVIERQGVGGAFGRSQELVRGHGWPVFGTVLTATVLSAVATLVLGGIAEAIAGGPILRIVLTALAATVTAPVNALVPVVLYYRLLAIEGPTSPTT